VSLLRVQNYISKRSEDPAGVWRMTDLVDLAQAAPPDQILQSNDAMIRADAYAVWFRWFIEGLCSPLQYVQDETQTVVEIYADIYQHISEIYPRDPDDERQALSKDLAQRVLAEVVRRRRLGRVGASAARKRELIETVAIPRCWVCGFRFSTEAIDKFLGRRKSVVLNLPEFVDILRPRGTSARDIGIEVEHVVPVVSGGGGDQNLALSCGWCNKSKGAKTLLYDADAHAPRVSYWLGSSQFHQLPHPFWTVRIMGTRRRCEHPSGCSRTVMTDELYLTPLNSKGSPNPSNLGIVCEEHDPFRNDRFYARDKAKLIWNSRTRGPS